MSLLQSPLREDDVSALKWCFVTEHWTVMDLQEVQGPSRADKPQQGASLLGTEGPPGPGPQDLLNESRLDRSEQWTGSYDCMCVSAPLNIFKDRRHES